jgi:tRNA1(Val) A37 N6-methylase TrmN6
MTSPSTIDAFHRGKFRLVQPAGSGHRAGTDAMILAAAVPSDFSGRLADFGAGAGAAGLAVASRCPRAEVLLVERSPEMAGFAERSIAHPGNAALARRVSVLVADVAAKAALRVESGIRDSSFDFVIMNPPFNAGSDRPSPDATRREAHVMGDGLFEDWIRSAAAAARPRGGLAVIARPQSLQAILAALERRFGGAGIVPVHPRPGADAIRIVVRAVKGSRGRLTLCPPLFLHEESGNGFSARADAFINGQAALYGD